MVTELSWDTCLESLRQISGIGIDPVVVGGQAVNFWMVYFAHGKPNAADLVLSKDLDSLARQTMHAKQHRL